MTRLLLPTWVQSCPRRGNCAGYTLSPFGKDPSQTRTGVRLVKPWHMCDMASLCYIQCPLIGSTHQYHTVGNDLEHLKLEDLKMLDDTPLSLPPPIMNDCRLMYNDEIPEVICRVHGLFHQTKRDLGHGIWIWVMHAWLGGCHCLLHLQWQQWKSSQALYVHAL